MSVRRSRFDCESQGEKGEEGEKGRKDKREKVPGCGGREKEYREQKKKVKR